MSSGLVTSDATDLQSKSSVKAQENTPSSPLTSLPSTPTPAAGQKMAASKGEVTSADEMPPPPKPDASSKPSTVSRKRSREIVGEEGYLADGSQTVAGPTPTSRGSKRKGSTESATTIIKISASQAVAELQPDAEPLSQKVPPSGQGQASAAAQPAATKTKSKDKQKNAKASQNSKPAPQEPPAGQEGEGTEYETDTDASDSEESVPEEQIKDFDWTDLETRYHKKMEELGMQEHLLMEEFTQLMDYFYIWSGAGHAKEVDRSFKRLKTQVTYVQHEEGELEKKREHYIRVVEAFRTVGVLLDKPNWHQRVVPNRRRISGLRTTIENDQLAVARRLEGSKEIIQLKDWPPHVVDDIDMVKYHYPDHHAARCVVL